MRNALHLANHDTAGVSRGERHGKCLQPKRLTLHGDVAIGVGRRAADQGDMDGEAPEEQIVLILGTSAQYNVAIEVGLHASGWAS